MDGNDTGTGTDAPKEASSFVPALRFGALCGASGLVYGGVSGVLRTKHPVIRSLSSGVVWSALGTSFWFLRGAILREQFGDTPSPTQRTVASAIAGGLAGGSVSLAVNGRFPRGLIAFSLLGGVGQLSYDAIDDWRTERQRRQQQQQATAPDKPWIERVAESKWVPFKILSDEQYKDMLNEKLLGVEVEIALIDDRIQELRKAEEPEKSTKR